MNRILLILFLSVSTFSSAQNIPLYQWRCHLPYNDGIQVVEVGSKIYCATLTGLFYYDRSDKSIHPLCKVDGYSDIFVKTMAYDKPNDMLFIAYNNGNLDIVHAGRIMNYSSYANQLVINNINIYNDTAWFSTNKGLIIWQSTLGDPGVGQPNNAPFNCFGTSGGYRSAVAGRYVYACSDSGVKRAVYNYYFINDCDSWKSVSNDSCSNVVSFSGKLFGAFKGGYLKYYDEATNSWTTIEHVGGGIKIVSLEATNGKLVMATDKYIYEYNSGLSVDSISSSSQKDVIADEQGVLWEAKNIYAMISYNQGTLGFYQPGGKPLTNIGNTAIGYHNQIWVSAGVIASSGSPGYNNDGFYMYDGENWHSYYYQSGTLNSPDIRDFMGMAFDTVTNHLWIACLDSGIVDYNPAANPTNNPYRGIVSIYYSGNTKGLPPQIGAPGKKYSPASGIAFDANDNMWASMYFDYQGGRNQLVERTPSGTWSTYTVGNQSNVSGLAVDEYGYIWLIDNRDGTGIYVYNPQNKTTALLTSTAGQGGLPSGNVNCIVKDKNGEMWIGTSAGPCVYSDPSLLFGNRKYDAQRPYISGSNSGYLLNALDVTSIAVDGANRKWYGTKDGAWLTSPEGDKIIQHFDMTNSALMSNTINAIAINGVTGEVFFVTDKGIVSYRGDATDGGAQNMQVYAFPNPVKPGYSGPITIRGLVNNANVKITDVTGALVYETTANGGEATWNGKNFSGRAANSGVYLVFVTNDDGSQTQITKIMIIR